MHGEKPYHQGQLDFFCAVYAVVNALRVLYGINLAESRRVVATTLWDISRHERLWSALLSNRTGHHWVIRYMLGSFCREGRYPLLVAYPGLERPGTPLALPEPVDLSHIVLDNMGNDVGCVFGQNSGEWGHAPGVDDFLPDVTLSPAGSGLGDRLHMSGNAEQPRPEGMQSRCHLPDDGVWPLLHGWLPRKSGFPLGSIIQGAGKTRHCVLVRFHRYLPPAETPLISHWSTGDAMNGETLLLEDCTANKQAIHELPAAMCVFAPEQVRQERYIVLEKNALILLERPA